MEKIQHGDMNLNSADIRARTRLKDKEGCHLMIKRSILQEGVRILNEYVPYQKCGPAGRKR